VLRYVHGGGSVRTMLPDANPIQELLCRTYLEVLKYLLTMTYSILHTKCDIIPRKGIYALCVC